MANHKVVGMFTFGPKGAEADPKPQMFNRRLAQWIEALDVDMVPRNQNEAA